ncbi:MAG TPA: ferritin-like domain-containing protein [Acidimicrobiales bacterium]|nr:ferritin-like domain-containing protein [Acidimicrobiales bacterium]
MLSEEKELGLLIERSEDTHADAMRATQASLTEVVERAEERRAAGGSDPDETEAYQANRRKLLTRGLAAAGAVGGGVFGRSLLDMLLSPAAAAGMDVQAAQTAASIENLAIAVYKQAAGLPFMKNIAAPAGPTVVAFVTTTVAQHTDHAKAFNAAATRLGGKAQTGVDKPVFDGVVTPALPTLKTPLDVVKFAAQLELVAAETYAAETAAVTDKDLRNTFASIAGVENQHRAILLAVAALLEAGKPNLIKLGPPADQLPDAAGSVGFPDAFLGTSNARPATEGAVA